MVLTGSSSLEEIDAAIEKTRREWVLAELDTVREERRRKLDEILELRHAIVSR